MGEMMSELIDRALAEEDNDGQDYTWIPWTPTQFKLKDALYLTGPLFHNERVFRHGQWEECGTYNQFIDVIEKVRPANEVAVPEVCD